MPLVLSGSFSTSRGTAFEQKADHERDRQKQHDCFGERGCGGAHSEEHAVQQRRLPAEPQHEPEHEGVQQRQLGLEVQGRDVAQQHRLQCPRRHEREQ